ncbi:complement C1q protein [Bacillus thuringiensis]|nr:complement C1q protein [Bacillus thuringiensis]MCA1002798.1 complement C1q protein [Bacillus thuringiensis]
MKKILAILPILLMAGMFTFSADKQKEEPKQDAQKTTVQRMMVDPGGGGL